LGVLLLILFALSQRGGSWCGEFHAADERNKSNLESLVRFGAEAIPAVDAALDSIDEKGRDSEFDNIGSFLLMADARLKGAAAFPRLRQMRGDPRFAMDNTWIMQPLSRWA
jgi:hypothetical protein